jgi:aminoglycoside/choline kinase family phosphotransferase
MPDNRLTQIIHWLESHQNGWGLDPSSLVPASSDASFRRYFRVSSSHPEHPSLIVMDAPPDKEALLPFIQVATLFKDVGLNVPQILDKDLAHGFLLLSDLGSQTYLSVLNSTNAKALYHAAITALIKIQLASQPGVLASYDATTLQREMDLFAEWFLKRHHQYVLSVSEQVDLEKIFHLIKENNLSQSQVYVHRDFHSRNLMLTQANNPGILDFQDALYGPMTYDVVSLLRDAYIEWSEEEVINFLVDYWERARSSGLKVPADFANFYRDFEWMGLQRHLKILGIFARLNHRDGKKNYLNDIPLVLKYTRAVASRYSSFKPLLRILDQAEKHDCGLT